MKLLCIWLFIGSVWAKMNQASSRATLNGTVSLHYINIPLHFDKFLHVLNSSEISAILQKRLDSQFNRLRSNISRSSPFQRE